MKQQFTFNKLSDFLQLDEQEFERMLPDFVGWYMYAKALQTPGINAKDFIWVDDGKIGELHHIQIQDNAGKTTLIRGSAYQEVKE